MNDVFITDENENSFKKRKPQEPQSKQNANIKKKNNKKMTHNEKSTNKNNNNENINPNSLKSIDINELNTLGKKYIFLI